MSDVVADQIRKHRSRLGLTREDLAAECAKLGADQLTFAALTNIETGRRDASGRRRRDVTIDELEVIAHALAVPMLLLVFPLGELDLVPVSAYHQRIHPHLAWKCATGDEPPTHVHTDGTPYADRSTIGANGTSRLEAWRSTTRPIKLHRRLTDEISQLRKATGRLTYFEHIGQSDSDEAQHVVRLRQHHLIEVATIIEELLESGMKAPVFDTELARELVATGVISRPQALITDEAVLDLLNQEPPATPPI
ncbi:hypothetical protein AB0M95_35515 [Sphaerisporangium sp. NPDC051017]|uniref:hypothetical protein n=1 Tax=Sphaerisporangium sp. NPDC051017 TaxID=3154636 RepID=UPI0034234AD4